MSAPHVETPPRLQAAVVEAERLAHERKVFLGRVVEAPQPECGPLQGVPSVGGALPPTRANRSPQALPCTPTHR